MRYPLAVFLALLLSSFAAFSQTTPSSQSGSTNIEPVAVQAIAAFATQPVHQIQLTGTAKAYAGSLQPTGTFTATLQSTGETKLQLDLGELTRTETTDAFGNTRKCTWTGPDAVQRDVSHHNCQTSANWLVPDLDLQTRITTLTQTVATETEESTSFQVLSLTQPPGDSSPSAALISRLSTARLLLDTTTFFPSSLRFNTHPDKDAGLDIPIVVRYSDYRKINGVNLPFHIQKYLNNGLVLDLQVETAEVQ